MQAGACESYEAALNLEAGLWDGLTLKQAKTSILKDGCFDGSAACFSAIKDEINQMPYAFPLVNQALYKRARRWRSIISELLLKKMLYNSLRRIKVHHNSDIIQSFRPEISSFG